MFYIGFNYDNDDVKWKKIYWKNGEETKYSVSNIGLVRNDNSGRILKTRSEHGYQRIGLTHNGKQKYFLVHVLVATAFIPNPENKPEVNHINGDKSCNYDYNLEWTTRKENELHAFRTGLNKGNTGKHIRLLTEKQIREICELLEENELTQKEISKKVGCSRNVIRSILLYKSHTDISKEYNLSNYVTKTDFSHYGEDNFMTKYSNDEIIKICEMIDSGKYKLPEIAKLTGVSYQTVRNVYYGSCRQDISQNYNFAKSSDNPLQTKKRNQVIEICKLLDKGLNTKEVAETLGISRPMVRCIYSGTSWKEVSKDYNFMKNKKKRK